MHFRHGSWKWVRHKRYAHLWISKLLRVLKSNPLGDLRFHIPWHSAPRKATLVCRQGHYRQRRMHRSLDRHIHWSSMYFQHIYVQGCAGIGWIKSSVKHNIYTLIYLHHVMEIIIRFPLVVSSDSTFIVVKKKSWIQAFQGNPQVLWIYA